MFHGLIAISVVAVLYAAYKHYGFSAIKAEILKLEAAGVADAKTIYATLKAKL
jgi:hypothetical protein